MITVLDITPEIIKFIKDNIKYNNFNSLEYSSNNIIFAVRNNYLYISNSESSIKIDRLNNYNDGIILKHDVFYAGIYQSVITGKYLDLVGNEIIKVLTYTLIFPQNNIEFSEIDEMMFNITLCEDFNLFKGHIEVVKNTLQLYAFILENIKCLK